MDEERSEQQEEKELARELSTMLMKGTLDSLRALTQALQTVVGLLLTGYLTLVTAALRSGSDLEAPVLLLVAPAALFTAALLVSFGRAAFEGSFALTVGDLESAVDGYESAVASRRRNLVLPSVLALVGVVCLLVVASYAL